MLIENTKSYTGTEVETIFFRPSFCGESAKDLGIRVIYNMPMPTTVQVWSRPDNVLQSFESGWSGGASAKHLQKKIEMYKVKAESRFSAEDYFSMILEKLTAANGVNYSDLTGTELEKAETELFRQAIAEGVRSTMWIGDTSGELSNLTTFNGILRHILDMGGKAKIHIITDDMDIPSSIEMLRGSWANASQELKALRSEGQLAYFVSSNVYNNYIEELDEKGGDNAYLDTINGRPTLYYHGIPVIEVPLPGYQLEMCSTFCLLTDRRNLVLALNTSDMPENEVRMWYNPDEMENRQRAVFLAGADVIDQNLVSIFYTDY